MASELLIPLSALLVPLLFNFQTCGCLSLDGSPCLCEFVMIFLTLYRISVLAVFFLDVRRLTPWFSGFFLFPPLLKYHHNHYSLKLIPSPWFIFSFRDVSLFLVFYSVIMLCLNADFFFLVCLPFIGLLEYGLMSFHQSSPIISLNTASPQTLSSHMEAPVTCSSGFSLGPLPLPSDGFCPTF